MLKILLIVGVIILAVVVQLSYVPVYPVKFDQAQVLYLAWGFVAKTIFPVHGILNSLRAHNPPFFVWLYLLPMMLTRDPSWVLILPALLLHVLALAILYGLGRRYFGPRVGLAAAVLYAFSTQGLYSGHASWAQGLLPPLYILIVFSLFQWLLEGKSMYLALLPPLVAWISGTHWGGALTVGVLLIVALLFRARLQLVPAVIGVLIALGLLVPFVRFEQDRAFADVRVLIQGRLPLPKPEEITPFCQGYSRNDNQTKGSQTQEGLLSRFKHVIRSEWPLAYRVLQKVYGFSWGMTSTLGLNYSHWSRLPMEFRDSPELRPHHLLERVFALIGVVGMGVLLHRLGMQRTATPAERLLLLSFFLPALLQNLSPHTTLSRPDVSWLFYGPQVLIMAYACVVPRWAQTKIVQALLWIGLGMLIILASHDAWGRVSLALRGTPNPQRQMVAWIAEDLTSQGHRQASIRYDFLQDRPNWCWIVPRSTLGDTYYVGTQHDYLLATLYGIRNTAKAADGWALDPDYIVLFPAGIDRYDLTQGKYQVKDFKSYVVLKVLE